MESGHSVTLRGEHQYRYDSRAEIAFPVVVGSFLIFFGFFVYAAVYDCLQSGNVASIGALIAGFGTIAETGAAVLLILMSPWFLAGAFTLQASPSAITLRARHEVVCFATSEITSLKHGWCMRGRSPDWTMGDWALKSYNHWAPSPGGYFIVFHVQSDIGKRVYGFRFREDETALIAVLDMIGRCPAVRVTVKGVV